MAKPIRLKLSRKKGFNLQEHSKSINGLDAVCCARPSHWGNPFVVGKDGDARECVNKFSRNTILGNGGKETLGGKNLACWCALDAPCHVDVLLEMANA